MGTAHRLAVVILLACVLWAPAAWADRRAEAKRHFRNGMALVDQGRTDEGITELEAAYELMPHPSVQFNIARAAENAGNLPRAIQAYRAYLETNPRDRTDVDARLLRMEAELRARQAPSPAPAPAPQPVAPSPTPSRAPSTLSSMDAEALSRALQVPEDADAATLRAAAALARSLALAMGADAGVPVGPPPPVVMPTAPPDAGVASVTTDGGAAAPDAGPAVGSAPTMLLPAPEPTPTTADAVYAERAVTASRTEGDVLDAPASLTVITREEIDQSGARTVPDLLRRVPGVTVVQMTQSDFNVTIRGLNRRLSNKILVLVDGRTVYQDFLGGTAWEALGINLEDIERIEVVRGPGAALYGASAFGGVVNIITRAPEANAVEGAVEVGVPRQARLTLRSTGVLALPGIPQQVNKQCPAVLCIVLQKLWKEPRVRAAASGGLRDAQREEMQLERPDLRRVVNDPTTAGRSARGFAMVELQASEDHALRVEAGAAQFRQDLSSLASLRNYILTGVFSWAQARYRLGPVSLRAFYNRLDLTGQPELTARLPDPLRTRLTTHLLDVEPLLDLPLRFLGEHRVVAGAAYRLKAVDWNYIARPRAQHLFSAFFQESWRPIPHLTFVASYRVDRHPLAPPFFIDAPLYGRLPIPGLPGLSHSARAAVIGRFRQTALRLSAGTAFRDPTFMESYVDFELPLVVDGAVFKFEGSPRLYPERIASVEAGISTRASDLFSVDASIYGLYVDRLIVTATPVPDVRGTLDPETGRYVAGRGGFTNSKNQFIGGGGEVMLRVFPLDGVDLDLGAAAHRLFETRGLAAPWEYLPKGGAHVDRVPRTATDFQARLDDPPFRLMGALRVRTPYGLEGSLDASLTGPTVWHEEQVDPTSPTGVRSVSYPVDPYLNTQVRIGYRLLDGAVVVSAVGQNLLAPVHREHPFGDRVGPRGLVTLQVRP